jgi:hypothetical protein
VLREGAISRDRLRAVLGDLLEPDPVDEGPTPSASAAASSDATPIADATPDAEAPGP